MLFDLRNDASPAGPSGSEGAPMQVMDMDIDLFVHSEAMENGRGTEPVGKCTGFTRRFPTLLFSNLFNEFCMKNHEKMVFWKLFVSSVWSNT